MFFDLETIQQVQRLLKKETHGNSFQPPPPPKKAEKLKSLILDG